MCAVDLILLSTSPPHPANMSAIRKIHVNETEHEIVTLGSNQLCFGLKVNDNVGKAEFNLIWKCVHLNPTTNFEWEIKYALGYSLDPPAIGSVVTNTGDWQPCDLGSSYLLDKYGFFQKSYDGRAGYLHISQNEYSKVYPIIGLWDANSQTYMPLYVDTNPLFTNSQALYQPGSEAVLWYTTGVQASQMAGDFESAVCSVNISKPNSRTDTYEWNVSFDPTTGTWNGDV